MKTNSAEVKTKMAAAIAEIKKLRHKLAESEVKNNRIEKYASLRIAGRKISEVVEEITADVKAKLVADGVSEEAAEQAADIVEIAVSEAVSDVSESVDTGGGMETGEELLEEDIQAELSEIATSDDEEDEIKMAAAKLLKSSKSKQAFGKELIRLVRKWSAANSNSVVYSGSSVPGKSTYVPTGSVGKAASALENYAHKL